MKGRKGYAVKRDQGLVPCRYPSIMRGVSPKARNFWSVDAAATEQKMRQEHLQVWGGKKTPVKRADPPFTQQEGKFKR